MKRPIASRRAQLLARSALCGVLGAMAIGASSATAQVTGVGTVTSTASNGGAVGVASGGGVTDVTINASRSIVNWANLTVTPTEALNFYFNNRSDIVVNRVAGAASIDGILNGCMATCATNGGNIWVLSTGGVLIGANAQVNTGGFLASTGSLTDLDILDGDMNFAFTGAPANSTISVANGASLNTNGGSLALIAPIVTTAAGSTVTATNGGDVIYGSAENYNVTFAPTGADDLDLLTFQVPSQSDGSGGTPGLTLNGTTVANQVFAAIVSKASVASSILLGGNITATTASGENGDIVLSAGSGFTNGVANTPLGFDGDITQNTTSTLTADNVTMRAGHDIVVDEINATGRVYLNSEWTNISQTGAITANILRAEAGGDIILNNTGNDFNFLSYIESQGVNGIDIVDLDGFVINDYIFHLGGGTRTASLTALTGSISATGSGVIQVGTLNVSAAGGSIDLGSAANNTTNLGTITAGVGDFRYRSLLDVNVAGAITATNVTLSSLAGQITESGGGSIVASSLTASASSGIDLSNANNDVATIAGLSNSGLGDIVYGQTDGFQITGAVTTANGGMSLTSTNGSITQTASGIITTSLLNANAGDDLILDQANVIGVVGNLTAGGGAGDDLVFNSTLGFAINGTMGGDNVTLTSGGSITQGASSTLTANRLIAGAVGDITLYDGVNNVATIGGLSSTSGDIVYRDVNGFDIQGNITANNAITRGAMLVAGGAGGITQTSGVLDVGYFRGIAGSGITLGGANLIRRLISTTISNGALTLNTTTDLSVDGTVAANAVSLSSTGAITQATNAQLWTTTLNASAVTGINLTASGFGANNISNLGVISNTTSGGITIANATPTNLTGNITAAGQAVSISNTLGGINQTGGIITAGALSLSAAGGISATRNNAFDSLGDVTAGGGVAIVNVGDLNLTGDVNTGGGDLSLTSTTGEIVQSGGVITATTLNATAAGDIDLDQTNAVSILGVINAGAGTFTFQNAGGFQVAGAVTADTVDLTSNSGAITESGGGSILASSLTASASSGINLFNANNNVSTIAGLANSTSGDLVYGQTNGFQITGAVTAIGQGMSLSSLNGSITQTASGIITTDYLNAGAGDDLVLDQANVIGAVGNLLAGGGAGDDLVFNSTLGFTINGTVGGDDVTLTSGGSISQGATSRLFANLLTLDAVGGISLSNFAPGTGNDIDALGLVTAGGAVSIGSISALDLTADIDTDGNFLSLFSQLGLTQSGGVLKASILTTSVSTGSITLNRANEIDALGIMFAGGLGDLTFRNAGSFALTGVIDVFGNNLNLISNTGGIVQQLGGEITAANLNATAATGIILGQANNVVALGGLTTTTGNLTFRNLGSIAAPALTTPGTLTLISDNGSVSQTGAFNAASLVVSGQTGVALHTQVNDVDTILGLTSGAGDILYRDGDGFDLAGNVTSADIVSLLNGAGSITQSAGIITTNLLTATSADNITLNRGNQVSLIGSLIAGGDINFSSTLGVTVLNEITGDDVSITSGGTFTQDNDGDITASSLTIGAATGISLTNAGNNVSTIAGLSNSGSGGIAFGQTNGFLISGGVSAAGQSVSLSSVSGTINQTGSVITAGTLNASAAGTLSLNQGNDVDSLGVVSTGGSFLFRDVNGFDLTDNITVANQLVMLAQNGSITQTGGIITANDINAMATVDLVLGGANVINSISSLVAGNDLLYRQVGDLSVPTISAAGTVSLYSTTGDITQTGTITADTLVLGAADDIVLGQNFVSKLGRIDAGGDFTASDSNGLSSGALELTDDITVGGAMTLTNPGTITQTAGAITAASLTIDTDGALTATGPNSVTGATWLTVDDDVTWNSAGDLDLRVTTPGSASITSTGAILLDGGGASSVGGLLSLGAVTGISQAQTLTVTDFGTLTNTTSGGISLTTAGWVELEGNVTAAGQAVALNVTAGGIIQNGGVITADRFSSTTTFGQFLNSSNQVNELGVIVAGGGNFSFRNLGDLSIDGAITSSINVLLTSSTGSITQTATGDITAAGLNVSAATGITLNNMGNNAARMLGLINSGSGGISYRQANGIQIDGLVRALGQTVSLTSTAGAVVETGSVFTQIEAGTLNVSAAGAVTLNQANAVGRVSLSGTTVSFANVGSFAANVITGDDVTLTSTTGKITQTPSTGRIVANTLTASAATGLEFFGGQNDIAILAGLSSTSGGVTWRDMGGFDITGNITAAGQSVELISDATGADGDDITQSGGVITAQRLNGNSAGDFLLAQANAVTQLGLLNANGDFTYRGAGAVTLMDNLSVGSVLTLISDSNGIMQNGGVITAQTLNASSALGIGLSRLNDVDVLGDIDGGVGEFSFRDIDGLDLAGDIEADFGVILQTGGALSQSGGSLTTANLGLFSDGDAILNGANNNIANLGTSNVLGDLSFSDIDGFTIDGGVRSGSTLTLAATAGDIVELSGGALDAQTLNVTATTGEIDLAGDNAVIALGDIIAGGDITFHNTGGFTLSGDIEGDAVRLTAAAGAIDQTGGSIVADSLYASAFTGLILTSAGNDVDAIVGLVNATSGGVSYQDSDSVDIAGAVTASGQTVTFDVGGDLTQSGAGVITARRVQGSAVGAFNLGDAPNVVTELGSISGAGIAFTAAGALDLTGNLASTSYVNLHVRESLTQSAGGITGVSLRADSLFGDIELGGSNDLDSIGLLYSDIGDVTYNDIDGFQLDPTIFSDIWAGGTMILSAVTGDITQSTAGLRATTLNVSAGGNIVLDQANQVGSLGAMTAGADISYTDLNGIALTGDVTTGVGGFFVITSTTGAVVQTGGLITSDFIVGATAGDFTLNNFDGVIAGISSAGGDIDVSDTDDITFLGLIGTGASGSVTLTSAGSIEQGFSGRIQTGLLNLSAGTFIDLTGALRNDIGSLGSVSAGTSFDYIDDNDFDLTADIDAGASARLESFGGGITQTGGVITTPSLTTATWTGLDLSGANRIDVVQLVNGLSGDIHFNNAQSLTVSYAANIPGLVQINTAAGDLLVSTDIDADSIDLTAFGSVSVLGSLGATSDISVAALNGDVEIGRIHSGDDVFITAANGTAQLWDVSMYADSDNEADGQNLTLSAGRDAFLGADSEAAIGSVTFNALTRIGSAGAISVISTGGDAGVFLTGSNAAVDTLTAGGAAGTASMVTTSGDAVVGTVTGYNVLLKADAGDVVAGAVALGGGDYTLYGEDFSTGAFGFTGLARDISITDTFGDLTIDADMAARRNLAIDVVSGSLLDGTGNTTLVAGTGGSGDLSIEADNIQMSGLGAQGDVTLDVGAAGDVTVGLVVVFDDYNLTGGSFSTGALSPVGGMAGTWTITDGGGFDFSGQMLTYNGDIAIHAADVITGGGVQSIFGSILIDGLSDIDVEGLYAATDITVASGNDLIVDSVTAYGGDIGLTGRSVTVQGFAEAAGNVLVMASDGAAEVESATAGADILVAATDGDARLGQAILTGATGDLTVFATNGNAILGATDYSTIGSNNYFERAPGSTGTVSVTAIGGGAAVYLDHSDDIDLVEGDYADVTVENGDLAIGVLTAFADDVYAETLDGNLTIGDAIAGNGGVGLYAFGGDLTITGSVYGALGATAETDGLLDGSQAVSIDTGGDLDLTGGSVLLNAISADGFISVAALDGDVYVEFANAGGAIQVGSLTGDATLRGAEAPDGIAVFAANTATFGADDRSLITAANYGITGGGCGCGPGTGIAVISLDGDVVVNLQSVTGGFDVIGAAIDGDATVFLATGDLTIGDLAAFNIDIEVANGSLETAFATSSGGAYRLKAQDFLGDVLNPTLFSGALGDYTITDTLGGLDMTGVSIMAQGDIRIDVQNGGALTGDAQLSSISGTGQGDVTVTAAGITLGRVEADRDVVLNASAGDVDVANSVSIGRNYTLTGRSFSIAALTPLGARVGALTLTDTLGGLDYSAGDLSYGGDITIAVSGALAGGDITSATGDILIQADAINSGALSAANGAIDVSSASGAAVAASAIARDSISLYAANGDVALGAAALLGTGANTLTLQSANGGNVTLGAASAAGIGAGNVFTSAGSSTTAAISATGGDAFVNLDRSDALTSVFGAGNVGVTVRIGDFAVGSITAAGGRVDVDGPDGELTIGGLYANGDALIRGGNITLTDGAVGQDLTVDATGDVDFRANGRISVDGEISLAAAGRVTQAAGAGLTATGLTVNAGGPVNLAGINQIELIRAVDVAAGGFAYRSTRTGGFDIAGTINASGQTVDLRSVNGGISQSGGVIVAGRLTGASDGGVWLAGGNLIDELGDFANTGGAFFLNVDQALSIVGMVDSAAALRIQSDAMTVASTGTVRSVGSGDAVVLASDGVFTNNSGGDGVQAANGRWLIYSQAVGNPGGSTSGNNFGGLNGRSYYGSTYDFGSGAFSATPNAGNRFVYAYQPTLTVTPISQQITYNGQIPTLGALVAGLINGDLAADAWSGAPTISGALSKNVGTYGLSAALGSLLSDMNYAFSFGSGTLIIDPKALTGTLTANNKTYDGGTDATGSISLDGVVAGDVVAATATGFRFADRNAGLGKIVAALGAGLSGADAGNYTLGSVGTAVADILRRSLTGVLTANNKTYDGTTDATGSIGLTGVVAGDTVSASGTFSFADRNAGAGKVVNASGLVLSGADAGNYDLGPISGVADILRRAIGGTVVANNKTYDGSTAATGSINLSGVVAGDDIRAGGTLTFDNRNAGAGRGVSAVNAGLSGADAGNYTLTGVANGIADILRRAISITANNQSKRFGQGDPSLTYVVGGSLVAGDVLTGGLVRTAGEEAGVYLIGQGNLAASSNYSLTFTPGEFVIQIPPAGGVQSLQMLRDLGETSAFALDRDPSPGLIVDNGEDGPDPDDQAGVRPTSN